MDFVAHRNTDTSVSFFTYIPGAGNLLLQFSFPGGIPSDLQYITEDTFGTTTPNGDGISRAIAFSATGPGFPDTGGAVVEFGEGPVIVPEPGRIEVILIGLAGLLVIRRNHRGGTGARESARRQPC